jgi:hypothetical protein
VVQTLEVMRGVLGDSREEVFYEDIQSEMERRGVEISAPMAVSVRRALTREQFGSHEDGFRSAEQMLFRIAEANPGTRADLWVDEGTREFRAFFLQLSVSVVRAHVY